MLRLKVTPVVGLPQFTGWSQVAESSISVSVRLIVVYAIFGKHAGNVGRDISEKISNYYFYDAEQLHEFFEELISYAHENECKVYLSCAALNKNKSLFATYGGSVFLKRGDKSGKILSSEYEVRVVEGKYHEDDVFVLTTLQADQFLSEIQLKFEQGYDVDTIITSVVPGIHSQEDSSLSALVFIAKDTEQSKELNQLKEETAPFFELEEENFDENEVSVNQESYQKVFANKAPQNSHFFYEEQSELSNELSAGLVSSESFSNDTQASQTSSQSLTPNPLAKLSIDTSQIQIPNAMKIFWNSIQKVAKVTAFRAKSLLRWLLIKVRELLSSVWNAIKKFDFSNFKLQFFQLKRISFRSVFRQNKLHLVEVKQKKSLQKFVFVIVLILLTLGIIGFISYSQSQEEKRIEQVLTPIKVQIIEARKLESTDKIRVRETISSLIERVSVLESENEKSSAIKLVKATKIELEEYLKSISGEQELQELEVFYDLRLAKSDFIASGIDFRDGTLVVFDKELKQVLLIDHDTKKVVNRDFSDRSAFTSAVLKDAEVFLLSQGVYKFTVNFDEQTELIEVRELGDSNQNASLLDAYDRFVYVVNPEKRNIYRYAQTEDGYSEPVGWLKSATGITYEDLRSISVDGDVWLTTSDGQLKKFASGHEEPFTIRGLIQQFDHDIYAYTSENLKKLYVLDPGNNRLVILEKNGDFVTEIKSVSLGAASGISVLEDESKVLVISGSIVYQIVL